MPALIAQIAKTSRSKCRKCDNPMETDTIKLGVGTAFYHPDCIIEAYLNFEAADDCANVDGIDKLSKEQKTIVQNTVKKAKEAIAKVDPAEIKQKRKQLNAAKREKKIEADVAAAAKRSTGRVRHAPKRLVDEGGRSDDDSSEDDGKKKRKKGGKGSRKDDDEEDFAPSAKEKAAEKTRTKSARGRKPKKDTAEDENEHETEDTSDPPKSSGIKHSSKKRKPVKKMNKSNAESEEFSENTDEDASDYEKPQKKRKLPTSNATTQNLTGADKAKAKVEELLEETMKEVPAVHSNPTRLTAAQVTTLSKMNSDSLKSVLRRNNQLLKGTKDELLLRVIDRIVNGNIPQCRLCGGGKLISTGWKNGGETFRCPGFYDDDHFQYCNAKFTPLSEDYPQREPWIQGENEVI